MKRDLKLEAQFPFLAELGNALEKLERLTGQCALCAGTGKVLEDAHQDESLCPDCQGSGQPVTSYEIDVTCPLCGARHLRHTRDAGAPGHVMGVCPDCLGGAP